MLNRQPFDGIALFAGSGKALAMGIIAVILATIRDTIIRTVPTIQTWFLSLQSSCRQRWPVKTLDWGKRIDSLLAFQCRFTPPRPEWNS
jgi:hypothetical protein